MALSALLQQFQPADSYELEEGILLADIVAAEALIFGANDPTDDVYPSGFHYILLTIPSYNPNHMRLYMFGNTTPSWYKRFRDDSKKLILPGTPEYFNQQEVLVVLLAEGGKVLEKVKTIFANS